jgi:hypothetical protein
MPRFVPRGAQIGKLPYDRDNSKDAVRLRYFLQTVEDADGQPSLVNPGAIVNRWGVFGSDTTPDAVFAAFANGLVAARAAHGKFVDFTDTDVKRDFAAASGWNGTDSDDSVKGIRIHDALQYWLEEGLAASDGSIQYIAGYTSLKVRDADELERTVRALGWSVIGIRVYKKFQGWYQTVGSSANQDIEPPVWSIENRGGGIAGLTAVPVVGLTDNGDFIAVVWGRRQIITREYYERFSDEAWAVIEFGHVTGDIPVRGLRRQALGRVFAKRGPGAAAGPQLTRDDKGGLWLDGTRIPFETPGRGRKPKSQTDGDVVDTVAEAAADTESSATDESVPQPVFSAAE